MPDLPPHELERLRRAVTGRSRASLILAPQLTDEEQVRLDALVARRLAGEPLQYLEGTVDFGGLEFAVDPRALIPRPETEELFEIACSLVDDPGVVVDLCTGSGALALALKHRFPDADVYATELSPDAASLARENAARLGLEVSVLDGDLFEPLPGELRGSVDLLVANPPYVADTDVLPADVADHEPAMALFAGSDGLDVIRRIGEELDDWLAPHAVLLCEIGETQRDAAAILGGDLRCDVAGRLRFVVREGR